MGEEERRNKGSGRHFLLSVLQHSHLVPVIAQMEMERARNETGTASGPLPKTRISQKRQSALNRFQMLLLPLTLRLNLEPTRWNQSTRGHEVQARVAFLIWYHQNSASPPSLAREGDTARSKETHNDLYY